MNERLLGYAGCAAIIVGCFLPLRHVMYRDITALQSGLGIVFLVLAAAAAALIRAHRTIGAAFCAAGVLVLLGLQYAMMSRINAVSSMFWSMNAGESANAVMSPVGLHVHPGAGFYVIAIGALALALAPLYRRRDTPVEYGPGGAGAAAERNGHATIREREFDRPDRTD